MICPFTDSFDVDCVYCCDGCCDDIGINSGNGDAWCVKTLVAGEILTGIMPGTLEWVESQENPCGTVQSAIINHRVVIKEKDVEELALETSRDYKPWRTDLGYQEYFKYGFIKGQKSLCDQLNIKIAK